MNSKTKMIKSNKPHVEKQGATDLGDKITTETETEVKKSKQAKEPNQTNRNIILIILLIIIFIAAVGYFWFELQQQKQTIENSSNKFDLEKQSLVESKEKIETSMRLFQQQKEEEIDALRTKIIKLESRSLSFQSQLNLTQQQMNQKQGGINHELMLGEADFLISSAAIRLLLTKNSKHSIKLLEAADIRLVKINDVSLFPVREALNNDLHQLKASEQIDITGSYLKLETIAQSLQNLRVNFILPKTVTQKELTSEVEEGWFNHLSSSTENVLSKWFQVTHHDEIVKPLVSVEQGLYLKQSLQLLIKQAQWALIQNNTELYQSVLESLRNEIKQNFDYKDPLVATSLEEIAVLISSSMVAPLPEILNVEKAIKIYLEAKNNPGIEE